MVVVVVMDTEPNLLTSYLVAEWAGPSDEMAPWVGGMVEGKHFIVACRFARNGSLL